MAVKIPNCPYCGAKLTRSDKQVARGIYWHCSKCSYKVDAHEQYVLDHINIKNPLDEQQ